MSIKLKSVIFLIVFTFQAAFAQQVKISKVEPPNWWSGMKYNHVQLMVYGEGLQGVKAGFNSPKLKVVKVNNTDNPSYAFIDIDIPDNAAPGTYTLTLTKGSDKAAIDFPVLKRENPSGRYQGFSPKDVIYMITPDRFANGDRNNDEVAGMNDHYLPDSAYGRHGGDIQGIIDHLDYIKDLGVTAVWVNPLVENNTRLSYHGYAVTDHYKIDARFGTNELYKKFVEEAHKRGLKVILDHVNNHISSFHPWLKNLPAGDWLNGSKEQHNITRHINSSVYDIHSDPAVRDFNNHGWFVHEMPDLNQRNLYLAKYLTQNTIWWIEYSGLDGIREDTYPYPDQKFLSEWNKTILAEYPKFNIVGEVWMGEAAFLAPFQAGSFFPKKFDTNLPSVTDFAFRDAAADVFANGRGMRRMYDDIAKDYLFPNPSNLVTFLDNHDVERIMYLVHSDMNQFRLALELLLTTRGIPQLYYGTEIGIVGGPDDGRKRADFPGGFPNSSHNAFTKEGRTEKENEIYDFIHKLLEIRKSSEALQSGKLIHFPPFDEVYPYLRISDNQTVLVVLNGNKEAQKLNISSLGDHFKDAKVLKSLLTGKEIKYTPDLKLELDALTGDIFEVK